MDVRPTRTCMHAGSEPATETYQRAAGRRSQYTRAARCSVSRRHTGWLSLAATWRLARVRYYSRTCKSKLVSPLGRRRAMMVRFFISRLRFLFLCFSLCRQTQHTTHRAQFDRCSCSSLLSDLKPAGLHTTPHRRIRLFVVHRLYLRKSCRPSSRRRI